MSAPTLAFVESNTTGSGRLHCDAARKRGLHPIVLTRDPARYPYLAANGIESLVVDTGDREKILAACAQRVGSLVGVTSSSEYFVSAAAWTAGQLGLPAPDWAAIDRTRDKSSQRELLRAAAVAIPGFRVVGTAEQARRAAADLGLPVVVKPVDGSGSVGVRLCDTDSDVGEAAARLLDRQVAQRDWPASHRILVEQYVVGPEFSVELFDGEPVGVTTKHLGPPPHFVETGHDFPARLDAGSAVTGCARAAVRALGLSWGAAHAELRLGPAGPQIIEVNPRLAGGMIPELVLAAYGVDLVDCVVARACGDQPVLCPRTEGHASIRFLLASQDGEVAEIRGLADARSTQAVRWAEVTVAVGDRVRLTGSFKDRIGAVIAAHRSASVASTQAERAIGKLAVRMTDADATGMREA